MLLSHCSTISRHPLTTPKNNPRIWSMSTLCKRPSNFPKAPGALLLHNQRATQNRESHTHLKKTYHGISLQIIVELLGAHDWQPVSLGCWNVWRILLRRVYTHSPRAICIHISLSLKSRACRQCARRRYVRQSNAIITTKLRCFFCLGRSLRQTYSLTFNVFAFERKRRMPPHKRVPFQRCLVCVSLL